MNKKRTVVVVEDEEAIGRGSGGAVLRRSPERPTPVLRISGGDTTVDCGRREVCHGERERVALSEMEADILQRLASHAGRVVTREELLACVWGLRGGGGGRRALGMHH